MALEHAGATYDDVRIDAGDASSREYKRNWFDVKPRVGMPCTNLPYILDGGLAIAQSGAILRHVGRQYKMLGASAV